MRTRTMGLEWRLLVPGLAVYQYPFLSTPNCRLLRYLVSEYTPGGYLLQRLVRFILDLTLLSLLIQLVPSSGTEPDTPARPLVYLLLPVRRRRRSPLPHTLVGVETVKSGPSCTPRVISSTVLSLSLSTDFSLKRRVWMVGAQMSS